MKKNIVLTFLGVVVICLSCKDEILDKQHPYEPSIVTYYKTGDQIVSAVNAVYSSLQSHQLMCREYYFTHDLRSDDMQAGGGQLETHRAQILNGVHRPDNYTLVSVWQGWYRIIHQANTVIENAPKASENVTEELKARVIGEAKFLRGWAFFDLATLWGGVPLMTTYAKNADENLPRATEDQVYAQIIADLTDAAAALPLKSDYSANDLGRASKGAAQAMLARVYMQRGQFAEAKSLLQDIISSNQYRLIDNYLENFREENELNEESVWEVIFSDAFGGSNWNATGEGSNNEVSFRGQEYGPTAWRNVIPSNSLLAEFEKVSKGSAKDDPRYNASFYFIGDKYFNDTKTIESMQGADPKISWKKYQRIYKSETEDSRSGINLRIIRYAEVLLMMAECENETGNPSAAVARLNDVRSRKGVEMPPYPTAQYPVGNKDQIMEAIMHEKRVELGGEQVRNRDLLRWRKLGKLKSEPFAYFQANKHELLPIPQQEINNNDKISQSDQNPGY